MSRAASSWLLLDRLPPPRITPADIVVPLRTFGCPADPMRLMMSLTGHCTATGSLGSVLC